MKRTMLLFLVLALTTGTAWANLRIGASGTSYYSLRYGEPTRNLGQVGAELIFQARDDAGVPGPIMFRARYQDALQSAGLTYKFYRWAGVDFIGGANFLVRGATTNLVRLGGEAVITFGFMEETQPIEFRISVGYLPGEPGDEPDRELDAMVLSFGLVALTQ